jgi:hypothetical protein
MRNLLAAWGLLLLPAMVQACDVCGIFLGIQPHDRTSSVSLLWRYRHLEGTLSVPAAQDASKHGGHSSAASGGSDALFRELYMVAELRADIWLGERFAVLASVPMVNNYRAVNGYVESDVYGMGDALFIARYLVANTKCTSLDERVVHRLMLGAGAKLPLGRSDVTYGDALVDVDQQPGTGTWDLLGSAEYMVRNGRNGAALTMVGRYNGTNADGYRLGHGLSTTVELFRRWDLGENWKVMPSLGLYHELSGRDADRDAVVDGTGSSTLFTSAGARAWWRSWGVQATCQIAVLRDLGYLMVPNRERFVIGLTYNLIKN